MKIKEINIYGNGPVEFNDRSLDPFKPSEPSGPGDVPTLECIVAIDICESAAIVRRFGDHFFRNMFDQLTSMITNIARDHPHRVVKDRGDGFLLSFDRCEHAVRAMILLLRTLRDWNASQEISRQLDIRIGVDYGPVLKKKDDPKDRCGAIVVRATRIEGLKDSDFSPPVSLPEKNRLLVSHAIYEVLKNVENGPPCKKLGLAKLKGFEGQLIEIYVVTWF
ncbi:MAG: adenylate/guanylate cyclase domain-containing protein [Magnetococcales bacterium]|nr:adenylate/guanylate cyclase domain-containing protein [Magnetococcales bacterium]